MDEHLQSALWKVERVMERLYTEDRMSGDQMRNAAQLLESVLDQFGYERQGPHASYDHALK